MYEPSASHDTDSSVLAVAAGLVAALVGGVAWAAIALLANLEIGWAAWGVGALVGFAMARTTRRRSRGLAVTAALLALLGLVAGKGFVVAGSAGSVTEEILASPEWMEGATAWRLYEARELAPATLEELDGLRATGDTVSDALWANMRAQAADRLATMPEAERRAIADEAARGMVRELGLVDGIRAQLSLFDLLWMILALGTAFRMMDTATPALAEEPELASDPEAEREPAA